MAFRILGIIAFLLSLGVIDVAQAQVTTSNLRGSVVDADGKAIEGAEVLLELPSAQVRKTATTSAGGQFAFTGLRVGGPYSVTAKKSGLQDAKKEGIQLVAGNNDAVVLSLGQAVKETISVTSNRQQVTSAKSSFFASDIQTAPAANQDLKDILRRAPDVTVDGTRMSVAGSNNRFNSITVDGMRQDDSFGLNNNGYPTQRSPISLQAVEELSVERSPFDVRYGNFLGGGINIVTKSGTDEFTGSVFVARAMDNWMGRKTKHQKNNANFEENRVGFTLGGPVIPEKLYFFTAIEGLTATRPSSVGPAGSGESIQADKVSFGDVARVQEISNRVYNFDAGKPAQSQIEKDLKGLLKLDYKISDAQRMEFKYQRATSNNISTGTVNANQLPLTSYWFDKQDTMDTASLRLFSDWSNELTTKVGVSNKKVVSESNPLNGNGFMEAEIKTPATGSIFIGPDRSRHKNELRNSSTLIETEANYLYDTHLFTGGIQHEKVDIWNIFVPFSNGFATYNSIEDFENRRPSRFQYQNAISNNSDDAAANWGYGVSTFLLQDEWQVTPKFTARLGLRSEFYSADGDIEENATFVGRYGYSNKQDITGKSSHLPRLGLAYKAADNLNVRGGFGLFGGGTPNVWLSNSYTNDGVTIDEAIVTDAAILTNNVFDGRNVPPAISSQLVSGDGNVDVLDPDFKIPQSYKFQTGLDYRFDIPMVTDDVRLDLNYTYTKTRYGLLWKDLRRNNASFANNLPTAQAPDGRAIYDTTPASSTSGAEFNTARGYDLLMTNTDKGYSHTASAALSKRWNNGFNVATSYAWQDVQEVSPGTSSQSSSNYGQVAIKLDPNDPGVDRSIYETKHRILLSAGYDHDFFEDLATSVGLLFERRSGQPYSFTMGGNSDQLGRMYGESSTFSQRRRMLFYVPKGDGSDVILDSTVNEAEFNAYLKKHDLDKYRGKITPRNGFTSDWVQKLDMRIGQELPGYKEEHKARVVLDLENLPNLLNKKWGQVKQADFPYMTSVTDVSYNAAENKYVYSNFRNPKTDSVRTLESVWKLQIAMYYNF